jgi:hypothetical protein
MLQSWDMGQIPKEGMWRIFRMPEKSNFFGRV